MCSLLKELGNNLEKCKNNETLQQILTNATIMVVSVTASTTQGWVDYGLLILIPLTRLLRHAYQYTWWLHDRLYNDGWLCVCFHGFRSLLSEDELKQLEDACDMALELNQSKHGIYEYVESRMSFIAPNLSVIVGASTAAKIMGEWWGEIYF